MRKGEDVNCPNCGTSNLDNASVCVNCGRPLAGGGAAYTPPPRPAMGGPTTSAPIPNYLVQSILVTLCCCLPLGVVAIIFAAQVNSKLAAGDVAGAMEASRKAKMFCWIGAITGIVVTVLWIVFAGGTAFLQGVQEGMQNR
jgi:hypothetical protein